MKQDISVSKDQQRELGQLDTQNDPANHDVGQDNSSSPPAPSESTKTEHFQELEASPEAPKSIQEIKDLKASAVHYIHRNYKAMTADFDKQKDVEKSELLPALRLRFYEQDLPFPKGKTVQMYEENKKYTPNVKLELPKTLKEVAALSTNRLSWVYAHVDNDQ